MAQQTRWHPRRVTIGDTEVEIRETDDGFEAVEVPDEPEISTGWYMFASNDGSYGAIVPLDSDWSIESRVGDTKFSFVEGTDVSGDSLYDWSDGEGRRAAYVSKVQMVRYNGSEFDEQATGADPNDYL